jgi:hypothetical protein
MSMHRRLRFVSAVAAALSVCCGTPAAPVPEFRYVASHACSNVLAYTWNELRTEYFVVSADVIRLGITLGSTRTFDVASMGDHLKIHVDMYRQRALDLYCSDVKVDQELTAWRATSGIVTIAFPTNPDNDRSVLYSDYRVVITVADLVLQGPGRQRVSVAGPITLTGRAGGNPFG